MTPIEDFLIEERSTHAAIIESWSSGEKKNLALLARRLTGIKGRKLPAKGTKSRKRYDAELRALERREPGVNPKTGKAKQARKGAAIKRRVERLIKREQKRGKYAVKKESLLRKSGGRANVRCLVKISDDKSERTLGVTLSKAEWSKISDLVKRGETKKAADYLEDRLLIAAQINYLYTKKGRHIGVEIIEVYGGTITPN